MGRIGRPHGVRGEVSVDVRTDDPDARFTDGVVLQTEPAEAGPLRVVASRPHSGRLLVTFEGVADRTAAEALRGVMLTIDTAALPRLDDPEEYYDHQLVGLVAVLAGNSRSPRIGEVADVLHLPGGDTLVLRLDDGEREVLVPFVRAIVPVVDLPGGRLELAPPEGLFDADLAGPQPAPRPAGQAPGAPGRAAGE